MNQICFDCRVFESSELFSRSCRLTMSQFSNFLSKLNIDQGGVDVAMKKKTVHISGKDVSFYNKLFDLVDYDEDDKVGLWICRHG